VTQPRSQVTVRTALTVAFALLGVVLFCYLVYATRVAITLTLLAVMLAVAIDHAVSLLQRKGMRRGPAIALVAISMTVLAVVLAFLVIPPTISQGQTLYDEFPKLIDTFRKSSVFHAVDKKLNIVPMIDRIERRAPRFVLDFVHDLISLALALGTVVVLSLFMVVFGAPVLWRGLDELPLHNRDAIKRVLKNIYDSIGGYVTGISLICLINTLFTTVFLAIVGMPAFLPLAVLSGMSSLVPYAGSIVTSITITLLAFVTKGPWQALACAIWFVTYGQIEGNLLTPLIFRRTLHVNPLVTTLAVLFFGEMGGVLGAIFAVPIVAAIQIITKEIIAAIKENEASASTPK
jgi:predicted PurR-regulated permease PerM